MSWLRRRRGAEEAPTGAEPRNIEENRAEPRGGEMTPANRAGVAPAREAPAREETAPVRRRRMALRARSAGAGADAVGAAGAGALALARLVTTVAFLIALLIAAAIVLTDVDANASNG